jgi:hypothetical protein
MTTPPTPAGWYSDPDGSGGQRYWDGSAWTEHQASGPHAEPGSEEPTAVVQTTGGAHRAPEPDPEPPAAATPEPSAPDGQRQLIIKFGAVCAALLAVMVVVFIYAFFIHKNDTITIGASSNTTTSKSASATSSASATPSESETTTATAGSAQATDGGITFAVDRVDTAPSVKQPDTDVEATAQGQYAIVHLTLLNSGDAPATFVGMYQKLTAGGTAYAIDNVATAYLNGTVAQLNPGDTSDVAIAFDVPPGTTPESLEVHGEAGSAGVELPLS